MLFDVSFYLIDSDVSSLCQSYEPCCQINSKPAKLFIVFRCIFSHVSKKVIQRPQFLRDVARCPSPRRQCSGLHSVSAYDLGSYPKFLSTLKHAKINALKHTQTGIEYPALRDHTREISDNFLELLLKNQAKALSVNSRQVRWHPLNIKWCLRLCTKSHSHMKILQFESVEASKW